MATYTDAKMAAADLLAEKLRRNPNAPLSLGAWAPEWPGGDDDARDMARCGALEGDYLVDWLVLDNDYAGSADPWDQMIHLQLVEGLTIEQAQSIIVTS